MSEETWSRLHERLGELHALVLRIESYLGSELGFGQTDPSARGNFRRNFDELRSLVSDLRAEIEGDSKHLGVRGRVAILWHTYMWILAALGGVLGWIGRGLID